MKPGSFTVLKHFLRVYFFMPRNLPAQVSAACLLLFSCIVGGGGWHKGACLI